MSKFKNLLDQARQRQDEPDVDEPEVEEESQEDSDRITAHATKSTVAKNGATKKPQTKNNELQATSALSPTLASGLPVTSSPTASSQVASATNTSVQTVARRGRPQGPAGGKRSDPDYEQISAYVPRKLHQNVKLALLRAEVESGEKQEFSTLIENLLTSWLDESQLA